MDDKKDLFEDYPCNLCIVKAICRMSCDKEHQWYSKLSVNNIEKY